MTCMKRTAQPTTELAGTPGVADQRVVRLVAMKDIEGPEWSFHRGKMLRGLQDEDGTWRVWPCGQADAFICCVPDNHVKRV